jgi:hypothetical protein
VVCKDGGACVRIVCMEMSSQCLPCDGIGCESLERQEPDRPMRGDHPAALHEGSSFEFLTISTMNPKNYRYQMELFTILSIKSNQVSFTNSTTAEVVGWIQHHITRISDEIKDGDETRPRGTSQPETIT